MSEPAHDALMGCLEAQTFDALAIKRYSEKCYLIIKTGGVDRVFVNAKGINPDYKHAWQIRDWLYNRFGIAKEQTTVENCDTHP